MEAPKCKLCGERHYGLCARTKQKAAIVAAAIVERATPESPDDFAPRKRAPNGTFDRNAYQREWMRRYRAKRKAEKS